MKANDMHDDKFQPLAAKLQKLGKELVHLKEERDEAMEGMEGAFDQTIELAAETEGKVKEIIEKAKGAGNYQSIVNTYSRWADMVMEIKTTLSMSRIRIEEIAQQSEKKGVEELVNEYEGTIEEFDVWIDALLKGGKTEEGYIPKVTNSAVYAMSAKLDDIDRKSVV